MIISPLDNGTKSHPFPHALVAGIERYPSKVTRRMSKKKQDKKSKVKPFIKQVNCTSRLRTMDSLVADHGRHPHHAHPLHPRA